MPVCGRAASVFSTFTDSAGRPWLAAPGSTSPVRGAVGGATVVVVGATVVVVAFGVAAFDSLPPHADTNRASAATSAVVAAVVDRTFSTFGTYISCNRAMRSSRGGWVSNRLLNFEPGFFLSVSRGCSIHIWAVALVAWCTTAWSSRNFSRAEIRPGGY